MDNPLQLTFLQRQVWALTAAVSLKQIANSATSMNPSVLPNSTLETPIKQLDPTINIDEQDAEYYFTSWDNWQQILSLVYSILSKFPWILYKADCNNRSAFMSSMTSILFGVNTCFGLHCEVYDATTGAFKYNHWCNLICDSSQNLYAFDADNSGQTSKITSNNFIMGSCKYHVDLIRCY